jgi:hypothetical protein
VKGNIINEAAADDSGLRFANIHLLHVKGVSLLMPPRPKDAADPYVQRVRRFLYHPRLLLTVVLNIIIGTGGQADWSHRLRAEGGKPAYASSSSSVVIGGEKGKRVECEGTRMSLELSAF